MGTKISELQLATDIGGTDLLEIAILDEGSPTGYSSRSIEYSNLIPPAVSGGCTLTKSGVVTPSEAEFQITITTDELANGCGIYYESEINALLAGTLRVSIIGYNSLPGIAFTSGPTSSISNIIISESQGDVVSYQSTIDRAIDVVALGSVVADPEAVSRELLVRDVAVVGGEIRLSVRVMGFGIEAYEITYNAVIDYNLITWEHN